MQDNAAMLDPQAMTSFLAVVNAGSFVGAAEATGLSKAAVVPRDISRERPG